MLKIIRTRPNHATIVAYLALFIALGGVSYAAVTLPRNSVGPAQIKPGAVRNSDLGQSAVTTGKVKDGSLLSIDFKPGQLVAGARGATGPAGPGGPAGPLGLKGDKGDPGTNGTDGTNGTNGTNAATNVTVRSSTCAPAPCQNAQADCLPGEKPTGGGGNAGGNQFLWNSRPVPTSGTPTGWLAAGAVPGGGAAMGAVLAYVICAAP